jgi:hypothetical protein
MNSGSGGPGRDCSGTHGGDGSMGLYCGGGVAALGPLLRGATVSPVYWSPAWWNPVWSSACRKPSISDEDSPDRV